MKYFMNCKTAEELKREYKKMVKRLHPDCGGDEEEFKKMQVEFSDLWEKLKTIHMNKSKEMYTKETKETAEEFMEIIEKLMRMEGVEAELCGSWLWITGDTKQYKMELKAMGARWSKNKICWYIHHEPYQKYRRKTYSLDEIRNMYGSKKFKDETQTSTQRAIDVL